MTSPSNDSLDEMFRRGLITPKEYANRKAEQLRGTDAGKAALGSNKVDAGPGVLGTLFMIITVGLMLLRLLKACHD